MPGMILFQLAENLDSKYNGVVFKRIFIDEDKFKGPADSEFYNICQGICHLHSRFLFNAIPIYILGSIYERFLGKVVNATDKRVTIVDKPEVRKAGGVYYTPKYIVDYIVQNTVGKLIESKTPEQIAKLRFVDISSGSGSFAVGMFECLLDYHNKYYQMNKAKAKKDGCLEKDGMIVLSLKQKQKILLNNIYGVDIDAQAVEVTLLSLYLKMLEDETTATANEMQVLFHEKILPDMSKNIICGNSLIGTDIKRQNQLSKEEELKLNPMDFDSAFPDIMRNGGFDAVVGNPPYVNIRNLSDSISQINKNYLIKHYESAFKGFDLYVLFIEKSTKIIRDKGYFGYIIPNKIAALDYAEKIRKILLTKTSITEIVDVSCLNIFKNVGVYPYLLFYNNHINSENIIQIKQPKDIVELINSPNIFISQSNLLKKPKYIIPLNEENNIIKIDSNKITELRNLATLHAGITGFMATKTKDCIFDGKNEGLDFIVTGNIDRYLIKFGNVRYIKSFYKNPKIIKDNLIITDGKWNLFSNKKIVIGGMTKVIEATYDSKGIGVGVGVYCINNFKISYQYILGLLNSKFITYYFKKTFEAKHLAGGYLAINKDQLAQLPIRIIDFTNVSEKDKHDKIVQLVEQMLQGKKQLQTAKTDKDKTYFERSCTDLDKQIDNLVYELYGLTKEEIKIIEGK